MKKWIIATIAVFLAVGLLLLQRQISAPFQERTDRLEIVKNGLSQEAVKALSISYTAIEYEERIDVMGGQRSLDVFSKQEIKNLLAGYGAKKVEIQDYSFAGRWMGQYIKWNLLVFEGIALAWVAALGVKLAQKHRKQLQHALETKYMEEILNQHSTALVTAVLQWAVLVIIGAFLLKDMLGFLPFVPGEYLPPQYIFDVGYYVERLGSWFTKELTEFGQSFRKANQYSVGILAANTLLAIGVSLVIGKGATHGKN